MATIPKSQKGSFLTTRGWQTFDLDPGSNDPNRDALAKELSKLILAENFGVLAGLGTSCCIKGTKGERLAPVMLDLWREAVAKAGASMGEVLKLVNYDEAKFGQNIEQLLSFCQMSEVLSPNKVVARFILDTEAIIAKRCAFVTQQLNLSVHEQFLRKVARRSTRLPRMKLFTTNYDLCFEYAASNCRFVVVDGFSHVLPQEFDGTNFEYDYVRRVATRDSTDYIPNVFHLYKVHGSIDWVKEGDNVRKVVDSTRPLLIYPRSSKFELAFEPPFFEMMSRFQTLLRQSNVGLMVVGFGFNDNHLAQPLLAAVRSNVSLQMIIVDISVKSSTNPYVKELLRLVQAGDQRILFIEASFDSVVTLIPDLVTATEEDMHRDRIKGVRKEEKAQ